MDKAHPGDHHPQTMALTLTILATGHHNPLAISFDAPRVVLGRSQGCDFRLPDASVSHRHASIRQRGTEYLVLDEGSTNGTFVGTVRLSPQAPRIVRTGDRIRLGRVWIEVRVEHVPVTAQPSLATAELALLMVQQALGGQGEPGQLRITVTQGPRTGDELLVESLERPKVIGRGSDADLKLQDGDASRRHAEVLRRGEQLCLRDLGSKNGTLLDGKPAAANKPVPWSVGATAIIGNSHLVYDDPARTALAELERAADELLPADDVVHAPSEAPAEEHAADKEPAEAPQRPRTTTATRATPPRSSGGWSGTDWLVAALAVIVLALSALGLIWVLP